VDKVRHDHLREWFATANVFTDQTPCPFCGLGWGFHDEKIHGRHVVARDKIKAKGWQLT
jgi:hypothetical protein